MKLERKRLGSVAVCLIMAMLLVYWLVPACFGVTAVETNTTIGRAERDLGSAYAVVAEAEGAGANVSALLNTLGSAGDFLSEAYAASRIGDYANASALAMQCSSTVKGVADDAARLKTDAEAVRSNGLLSAVVVSCVGLVLLVVSGFLGWNFLKQWYIRRVLNMKPQVEDAR